MKQHYLQPISRLKFTWCYAQIQTAVTQSGIKRRAGFGILAMSILLCLCAQRVCAASLGSFVDSSSSVNAQWSAYGSGFKISPAIKHGESTSIQCDAADGTMTFGAMHTITLNQTQAEPVEISGWSRASAVEGSPNNDYSIYVDLTYTDGAPLYGQTASFDTGTHDWQLRTLTIRPDKPIRSMNVYALFRNHPGSVWFADFNASKVDSSALFDGQHIDAPKLTGSQRAGWFIRDVATNSSLVPLGSSSKLHLEMDLAKSGASNKHVIFGTLRNLSKANRAVTVYFVERFDSSNPVWWSDIRTHSSAVASHGDYANLTSVNVGANGALSLYPFGCVTGQYSGLALGVPPSLGARVVRIGFNPKQHLLYLACDLALTTLGDPYGHDHASLAVTSFAVNPTWGFRDALAQYVSMFPDAYIQRAKADGIWMPFTAPNTIPNASDFGFGFHEGDNSVASDKAMGILSFRYVEPMTYWMSMPASVPRSYDAAMQMVQSQASNGSAADSTIMHQAQAVVYSGTQDQSGHYNVTFSDAPWCNGACWVLNPNPRLAHPANAFTKGVLNTVAAPLTNETNQPDGEYLDSLEAHADVLDYRPESLHASTTALTFATESPLRPTLPTWFSVYEAESILSNQLHANGKLIMANSVPWQYTAFTPNLDVMGTETNMFGSNGEWAPDSDAIMNLRRISAYHKPYLLLLNTDFSKTTSATIKLYFERCMFYGIYPSMFSADAASNPYWENPTLYNRDRPLFKTYIPLIRKLTQAGWQPLTYAHSSNSNVWIERFGDNLFTILNSSENPQTTAISLDSKLGEKSKNVQMSNFETGERLVNKTVTLQSSECEVLIAQ